MGSQSNLSAVKLTKSEPVPPPKSITGHNEGITEMSFLLAH